MAALRVRYRRAAASASGSFPGFPQLAKGLASGGALRLFTDQVLLLLLLLPLVCWLPTSYASACYTGHVHVWYTCVSWRLSACKPPTQVLAGLKVIGNVHV